MEKLALRSKAISVVDYREVDIRHFALPLQVDEARYARDLRNFRKRFATSVAAQSVEREDQATLSCRSALPRFNKAHIVVRVGLGMFTKELEQQLIGLNQGQTATLSVKGEVVEVTIEAISREILPELTDELVSQAGIDGVNTVADAELWCKGHQFDEELEEQADEVFAYIAGKVMEGSQFELDSQELEAAYQINAAILKDSSALAGRTVEEMTEAEFAETFYLSKGEMEAHLRQTAEASLKSAVVGALLMEQAGLQVTQEQYEQELVRMADATGKTLELVRQTHTPVQFAINSFNSYFLELLEAYAMRKLKEVCL